MHIGIIISKAMSNDLFDSILFIYFDQFTIFVVVFFTGLWQKISIN